MNSYDLAEIWVRCKDKLKESFNEKVFNVWIKPIMPLEVDRKSVGRERVC